tara:strand:- start:828 stop:983 length:156 start_codon:yes stop_codon:yes gene_type:complete
MPYLKEADYSLWLAAAIRLRESRIKEWQSVVDTIAIITGAKTLYFDPRKEG